MHQINPHFFYLSQILIGAIFITLAFIVFRAKSPESQFRVREADLRAKKKFGRPPQAINQAINNDDGDLANARMKKHEPLSLTGIRIDGKPHEILGVSQHPTPTEVQQAYRELMKRYHPDRVGRPGTREWNDAQKIAEAINRAKDALLKRR